MHNIILEALNQVYFLHTIVREIMYGFWKVSNFHNDSYKLDEINTIYLNYNRCFREEAGLDD